MPSGIHGFRSRWSGSSPSPRWLIPRKSAFVIALGSPARCGDNEAQWGESWSSDTSRGGGGTTASCERSHWCLWNHFPRCESEGNILQVFGVVMQSFSRFVSGPKGTLANGISWCFRVQEAYWRVRRSVFGVKAYSKCSGLEEACVQKLLTWWWIIFIKGFRDQRIPHSRIFPSLPISVLDEGHH